MSRGDNLYCNDKYVGNIWICDVCGDTYSPGNRMPEPFTDGRHICKVCLAVHIVEYFEFDQWPEIIYRGDKGYVVHCFEFYPNRKKQRVPGKLREKILLAGRCNYCGAKDHLQVDHIIPYSKGGVTHADNLQCLCRSCNSKKGDKINNEYIKGLLPKSADNS